MGTYTFGQPKKQPLDDTPITANFKWGEASARRGLMPKDVQRRVKRFAKWLQRVRDRFGRPMVVTSWYRTPFHHRERGKARPGAHSTGLAVDIHVHDKWALKLLKDALNEAPVDEDGCPKLGVGIRQRGPRSGRIIHLDRWEGDELAPRPTLWSY